MPNTHTEALYHGGICFVTDRRSCPLTCVEMISLALQSGVRWVQYRDKERDRLCVYRTALKLRSLTRSYGACFVVNDFTDIAAAVDADGVHLGQGDLPLNAARKILGRGKLIGISTHSADEAERAEYEGADYIGFGPIYYTSTKDSADAPKGTEMLAAIRRRVHIPVVAIGGITTERLMEVMGAGAHAVAVASGVLKGQVQDNFSSLLEGMSYPAHKSLMSRQGRTI